MDVFLPDPEKVKTDEHQQAVIGRSVVVIFPFSSSISWLSRTEENHWNFRRFLQELSLSLWFRGARIAQKMSTDQVIDLVTDENDEVIVIDDDSPKSSISEDSATMDAASAATIERAAEPAVMEQKPFAAQEPIPVDMDLDEVIPIPISNQT